MHFPSMTPDARVFYTRLFANVLLNAHAVQKGYFDTLLCETDDPFVAIRWVETLPVIAQIMRDNARRNLETGENDGPSQER
jgi:hypothetical protein